VALLTKKKRNIDDEDSAGYSQQIGFSECKEATNQMLIESNEQEVIRMKHTLVFVFASLILSLAAWGLLGSPSIPPVLAQGPTPVPTVASAFPVGAFDLKPINSSFTTGSYTALRYKSPLTLRKVYNFNADGSLLIHGHNLVLGGGKFTVTASQLSVVTPSSYENCPADQAGTYTWSFDGKTLSLTEVQDLCELRKADLTGA
jgi:hypothetical protein